MSEVKYQNYLSEIQELIELDLSPNDRIPLLRVVLDKLFKELTRKYQVNISGLQPRMLFYCQQENIPQTQNDLLSDLRIFCNKVTHAEITDASENNQRQCVKILAEFIASLDAIEIPEAIRSYYSKETAFAPLLKKKLLKYENIAEIQGVVRSFSKEIKKDKYDKGYVDISIESDDIGSISIRLTQTDEADLITDIIYSLWMFSEVIITDITLDTQSGYYYSTNRTLVILEPDYTVDVKLISECYEFTGRGFSDIPNPSVYQSKKFAENITNEPITKGYLLGSILDEIASHSKFKFNDKADEYFKNSHISSLALINTKGPDVINKIKIECQSQESNIVEALSRFNNHKVSIEPTFLSIKYGIQGRLDALYENKANLSDKTVIELKSGNYRFANMQHQTQTALYDLLLKSAYPNRIGNSYILYSQKPPSSLTLVNEQGLRVIHLQRKAMMIRNKIVSDEYKIANGDAAPILDQVDLSHLDSIERAYFEGYCKFICNEIKTAKEKHRNTLLLNGSSNSSSKFLSNLAILDVTDEFHITLNINPDNELLFDLPDFKENDFVMLFPVENDGTTKPLTHPILKSTIHEIDDERIVISLINKQLDKHYLNEYRRWAICQDLRESNLKRMYQQIYALIDSPSEKRKLILTLEKEPTFTEVPYQFTGRLTVSQNEIVKRALSANDYMVIQGPPGTGKTKYILTEIVRNIHEKEKVVVIAFTNQAVFEISRQLTDLNIDFLQIGGRGDMPYLLNNLANELSLDDLLARIQNTSVIVSTQHTLFTNLELLNSITFRTLIVDEASQLLEPQLVGILTRFERFILIGDEKQLPAISLQEDNEIELPDELNSISLFKYNESLFLRLILNAKNKGWHCFESLREQGRMHIDIADFPNQKYYGNKLEPISDIQKESSQLFRLDSENHIERCLALKRVLFIPSEKDKISFKNDCEQKLIYNFLKVIIQVCKSSNIEIVSKTRSLNEISIGIITPFRKQITNIKRIIPLQLKDKILVDTIEKFQGSERDIIFYSTSLNNSRQIEKLQSLVEVDGIEVDRKLNVAVTRARKHLIITGTKSILEKNNHYKSLIEFIDKKGGLINLTL